MKIVIAPDSFKESLSSSEVCDAIEHGFRFALPNASYVKIPLSDGGEGIMDVLVSAQNGQIKRKEVLGPMGLPIVARYGLIHNQKTAVLEYAETCGINLVNLECRNPLIASSYGFGELIKYILDHGMQHFIVGLGGSVTNDGGMGMLSALGVKFLDKSGKPLLGNGENLSKIHKVDLSGLDSRLFISQFEVACDVRNPLCGDQGASWVYGRQKGASETDLEKLERGMQNYADISEDLLGKVSQHIEGAGAAGGLGFALVHFLEAVLISGADLVLQQTDFLEKVKSADLVITGEGRMDGQSLNGKLPVKVAEYAKKCNVPTIAIVGSMSYEASCAHQFGIEAVFPCIPFLDSLENTLKSADKNVELCARNVAQVYAL